VDPVVVMLAKISTVVPALIVRLPPTELIAANVITELLALRVKEFPLDQVTSLATVMLPALTPPEAVVTIMFEAASEV
jgi:hypothetical protein